MLSRFNLFRSGTKGVLVSGDSDWHCHRAQLLQHQHRPHRALSTWPGLSRPSELFCKTASCNDSLSDCCRQLRQHRHGRSLLQVKFQRRCWSQSHPPQQIADTQTFIESCHSAATSQTPWGQSQVSWNSENRQKSIPPPPVNSSTARI